MNVLTKSQYRVLVRRGKPQNGMEVFTGLTLIREGFLDYCFGVPYITLKGLFAIYRYKKGFRK